jgi:hypothetical protein
VVTGAQIVMLATPVSVINSDQITSNSYVCMEEVQDLCSDNFRFLLGSVSKCGYRCYAPRFLTKQLFYAILRFAFRYSLTLRYSRASQG